MNYTLTDITREICTRSLMQFIKRAWGQVEQDEFVDNWHIQAMCEHLEAVSSGQIKRLLINVPPSSMKSLTNSVMFPCWEWAKGGLR